MHRDGGLAVVCTVLTLSRVLCTENTLQTCLARDRVMTMHKKYIGVYLMPSFTLPHQLSKILKWTAHAYRMFSSRQVRSLGNISRYDNVSCTRTANQQLESRETDLHWDSRMHEHPGSGKGVATPAT